MKSHFNLYVNSLEAMDSKRFAESVEVVASAIRAGITSGSIKDCGWELVETDGLEE